ncbi:MAG: bifunctional riboflavin kinase/FAD synthetase [Gammaproteobacteria bacterium]|nr:bifunctional riboflavin kinase/FAD synthetase [Gammaproteobacteria bacterium]
MQLIRRTGADRPALPGGCVATIGTFDGVHLGHQRIIAQVVEEARRRSLPALVFSFEPTPAEFFSRGKPPARLTRFREKFEALRGLAVDYLFSPPFDTAMERLEANEFIERLLVRTLGVQHLVVGDDFRFARQRSGDFDALRRGGEQWGFGVEQVGSVLLDDARVSSTEIRRALSSGELERARQLLGRYYRMTGRVVAGRKLGAQLGYPTANVNLHRRECAIGGIFAVRVCGLPEGSLDGVASLGSRPTVEGNGRPLLEVHIFDFNRRIYGEYISVEFVAKLRDEEQFPDLDSLTEQMHEDAARARAILAAA